RIVRTNVNRVVRFWKRSRAACSTVVDWRATAISFVKQRSRSAKETKGPQQKRSGDGNESRESRRPDTGIGNGCADWLERAAAIADAEGRVDAGPRRQGEASRGRASRARRSRSRGARYSSSEGRLRRYRTFRFRER